MTLRELRVRLGLSQRQLAALARFHQDTVTKAEDGRRKEPRDFRKRLADGLDAQAALVRNNMPPTDP